MRLGLLGPSMGDVAALGRAAGFLLNQMKVNRAVYLGVDGALDRAVTAWAKTLVGDDPSDEATWQRALAVTKSGTPKDLDKFVQTERSRLRLRALETLAEESGKAIEMVGDRLAVFIFDKSKLTEDDLSGTKLIIFGKSEGGVIERTGSRWFVSPGNIGAPAGGVAVLTEEKDEITFALYDSGGQKIREEILVQHRETKMRVQGDA